MIFSGLGYSLYPEPPTETSTGSKFLSSLRISGFFRFIKQTFGRLSESFGTMDQIDKI